ncbi:MAG: hypothetical protein V1893_02145, partial [Candidatus Omnitrophota bacterium]
GACIIARAITYSIPCDGATKEESRIPENGTYGLRKGTEIAKSLPTLFWCKSARKCLGFSVLRGIICKEAQI